MGGLGKLIGAKGFKKCKESPNLVTLTMAKKNCLYVSDPAQGTHIPMDIMTNEVSKCIAWPSEEKII